MTNELAADRWRPNLGHLEALDDAAAMSQLEYAEAWLWTHFLLSNAEAYRKPIVQAHLQQLVKQGDAFWQFQKPWQESIPAPSRCCLSILNS